MLVAAQPAAADSPSRAAYRQAVEQAYSLIQDVQPADSAPAAEAIAALESGAGKTQPEIVADLSSQPPDYADARARLLSLLAAVDQPAGTADPVLAQSRLHGVLSMSRYDALHRPPSLLDRFVQWLRDRFADLQRFLAGRGVPPIPAWYLAIAGGLILAAVAVVIFRSARARLGEVIGAAMPAGPRPPADYFAEADRLALIGDRVGAIRALCAGVAATLAGERTWEGSPLTVREIFQRAPESERLRPLLGPFEAAIYGGRAVDRPTYERAVEVAAPFRQVSEVPA